MILKLYLTLCWYWKICFRKKKKLCNTTHHSKASWHSSLDEHKPHSARGRRVSQQICWPRYKLI